MEMGSELSKTITTFIMQKLLLDGVSDVTPASQLLQSVDG
jgi:hypothetical protein